MAAFTALFLTACTVLAPREAALAELKEKKIDFDKVSFIRAARNGDIETVKLFLDAGMPADSVSDDGRPGIPTPLMGAILQRHVDVALLLIEKGAADETFAGKTALILSVSMGDPEITEKLISRGVPLPGMPETGNYSLLMIACGAGREPLLDDDYSPESPDMKKFMNPDLVSSLVAAGADVNEKDRKGCSALTYACLFGRKDLAWVLLEAGAVIDDDIEINYPQIGRIKGMPTLVAAASSGNLALVEMLVSKGAGVNSAGSCFFPLMLPPSYKYIGTGPGRGFTPLHAACYAGRIKVADYLIRHGADVNAKDANGRTPLMFARSKDVGINPMFLKPEELKAKDPVTLVKLLAEHGARLDNDLLFEAVQGGYLKTVAFLLDKGLDVNCRNNENLTPLMVAGKFKHKELCDYLLKRGASPSDKDKSGRIAEDYLKDEFPDCDFQAIRRPAKK